MDKTLIFSVVGIILLIIVIFLFIKNRKKSDDNSMEEFIISQEENNKKSSQKREPKINIIAVDFKVVGNKDKYTISFKGDKIQFFVKDNEIVGFLDVEKANKIYYYEKDEIREGEDKNV